MDHKELIENAQRTLDAMKRSVAQPAQDVAGIDIARRLLDCIHNGTMHEYRQIAVQESEDLARAHIALVNSINDTQPAQPAQDVAALVEEAGEVEDCHPTHAADYDLIQRLATALLAEHAARARAEMERDFAIAHDRQPYPTAWAYDRLAKANIKHIAERDALAARLAEAERERDEYKQAFELQKAAMAEQIEIINEQNKRLSSLPTLDFAPRSVGDAFRALHDWFTHFYNEEGAFEKSLLDYAERADAALARAEAAEAELARLNGKLIEHESECATLTIAEADETFPTSLADMPADTKPSYSVEDLIGYYKYMPFPSPQDRDTLIALTSLRAELAKLGPVEWQVNTDAIGWRQSTDVEVQHIRSFAVDRVRAIRVVNQ